MGKLRTCWSQFLALFRQASLDERLEEELQFHIEMQTAENTRRGLSPADARRLARMHSGGVEQIKELHRDQRGIPWFESLWQDVRFGARMLAKSKALTICAVVSLAIGIGVNLAVWNRFNGVLLKSPPLYAEADRLATVWQTQRHTPGELQTISPHLYTAVAGSAGLVEAAGAAQFTGYLSLRLDDFPIAVCSQAISAGLPAALGVKPALGRVFAAEECRAGGDNVVLLSHRIWMRRFDSDRDVLGQTLMIEGQAHTVIGVMPEKFGFWDRVTEIWLPLRIERLEDSQSLLAVFRTAGGDGIAALRARLPVLAAGVRQDHPELGEQWVPRVEPLRSARWRRTSIPPGILLFAGLIGLVLLLVCVNIANIMVGHALGREREMAIRAVLGAGKRRLMRQALTESLMLVAGGGALA